MEYQNNNDIREFLLRYDVAGPGPELVERTRMLMHEELERLSTSVSWQAGWIFFIAGLALMMCLGVFYTFTVGIIMSFILPENLMGILNHSYLMFTGAGGIMIALVLVVFSFKNVRIPSMALEYNSV